MKNAMIPGGYILTPRIIEESNISKAPPYVREIWRYLIRKANSKDTNYRGFTVKRGQLFQTYEGIREDLAWFIGWRKMTYNENHMKKAMKFLRDTQRITTTKEPGGVLITICNYDYYQNPKNYERTNEGTNDRTIEEPGKNHPIPDNNKNNKNEENSFAQFWDLYDKKVDRKKSLQLWNKLKATEQEEALRYLPSYIQSTPDKQYRKDPATFLRNQSWTNEIIKPVKPTNGHGSKKDIHNPQPAMR